MVCNQESLSIFGRSSSAVLEFAPPPPPPPKNIIKWGEHTLCMLFLVAAFLITDTLQGSYQECDICLIVRKRHNAFFPFFSTSVSEFKCPVCGSVLLHSLSERWHFSCVQRNCYTRPRSSHRLRPWKQISCSHLPICSTRLGRYHSSGSRNLVEASPSI